MTTLTKNRIIDAAIDLFSENGYAETSVRDIGKKTGIRSSSIYYHFESKEAILNHILDEYIKIVRESTHQERWNEEKDVIIAKDSKISSNEIVNLMFFKFEGSRSLQYIKMAKIICNEATRNEIVRDYLHYQANESFSFLKSILDSLLEADKILQCDTTKLACILYTITFAFMHFSSIGKENIYNEDEETNMFSLLEYMLKLVLKGSDE